MVHVDLVYIGVKKVDVCSVYMRIKKKKRMKQFTRESQREILVGFIHEYKK